MKTLPLALYTGSILTSIALGLQFTSTPSPSAQERGETTPTATASNPISETEQVAPAESVFNPLAANDLRTKLNDARAINNRVARFAALARLGYLAAHQDPANAVKNLSPDFWDKDNYDLRGCLFAEWMRIDGPAAADYLEEVYRDFSDTERRELFPAYHLAYLEPQALLETLPAFTDEHLTIWLKNELVKTLVECDPDLLWLNRDSLATTPQILNACLLQSQYDQAIHFWQRSGWIEYSFPTDALRYFANQQRADIAAHLNPENRTEFAIHYAELHPQEAALWVRNAAPLQGIEYRFESLHRDFFRSLFALNDLADWPQTALWLEESIKADHAYEWSPFIFQAIARNPQISTSASFRDNLLSYLVNIQNPDTIKSFYSSLAEDHPLLWTVESYLLENLEVYGDAIIARSTNEPLTPQRLFEVIEYGNLDSWPDRYFNNARNTLAHLNDSELFWKLSPDNLLSLAKLDPDRIQNLVTNADPQWILSTLENQRLSANIDLDQLAYLDSLIAILPASQQEQITRTARKNILNRMKAADDKTPYISFAQSSGDAITIANAIDPKIIAHDETLQQSIANHPRKRDFYLSLASSDTELSIDDPEFTAVRSQIARARDLLAKPQDFIASTLQTLQPAERMELLKTMRVNERTGYEPTITNAILELPFWSDADREELYEITPRFREEFIFTCGLSSYDY